MHLLQAGDSFDLASLACSLALGAGYDAAVVVGYVPKEVRQGLRHSMPAWLRTAGQLRSTTPASPAP